MDSFGVDHIATKITKSPSVKLDLVQDDQLSLLWGFIQDPFCAGVHLAPPCGTSSRAREIALEGRKAPRPLRNKLSPDGVAGLSEKEAIRVFHANKLYGVTAEIFAYCCKNGIPASVENPARSWMWETTFWREITDHLSFFETFCHHCMYGSNRKKWTKFVHSFAQMKHVSALCDGRHTHLPWGFNEAGKFSTSDETAYPWKLCKAIAEAYFNAWLAYGVIGSPQELSEVVNQFKLQLAQSYAGKQSRKKIPPLVKEFKDFVTLEGPSGLLPHEKICNKWNIPLQFHVTPAARTLPAGARLLRVQNVGVGADPSEADSNERVGADPPEVDSYEGPLCKAVFGVP